MPVHYYNVASERKCIAQKKQNSKTNLHKNVQKIFNRVFNGTNENLFFLCGTKIPTNQNQALGQA